MVDPLQRPIIAEYSDYLDFVGDMIMFRKQTEYGFSISQACKKLRRVSPTLVTLWLQRKRRLTLDRVDELSQLLKLTPTEKRIIRSSLMPTPPVSQPSHGTGRKAVGTDILSDWLNVYVKDCFDLPKVQENPELIYQILLHLATPPRIKKSIDFLLHHGHLLKTESGKIIPNDRVVVTETPFADARIRKFHTASLKIAQNAISSVPTTDRYANALLMSLTREQYDDLIDLIDEFAEKLKVFAENQNSPGDRLYQFILNLSPTGDRS